MDADLQVLTFAPLTSDAGWLRHQQTRIHLEMPDSLRALHLGYAIDYHLQVDPLLACSLTIATRDDRLLGAVAHAVTFDATGTECLVIGEIGTTGEVAGTGRALLSHLATQALMSGLEISCIADVGARGFYTHLGFVQDPPRDVRYVWGREAMLTALAQLSTPEIA